MKETREIAFGIPSLENQVNISFTNFLIISEYKRVVFFLIMCSNREDNGLQQCGYNC